MTAREQADLVARLVPLAELYQAQMSAPALQLWVQMVEDLDHGAVVRALETLARTSPYLPKPADVRRLLVGEAADAAQLAWAGLLREVRRVGWCGTPDLPEDTRAVVRTLWGSWARLCQTLPMEGPEAIGWQKQFVAQYGAASRATERAALTDGEARVRLADVMETVRRGTP